MRQDPGDIPTSLGQVDLVKALSLARDLPEEALELAADRPGRVAGAVLAVAARAARGEPLSDQDGNLLFWGLLVLGYARDLRLCVPLIALLRRPDDELYGLFDDAFVMEALPRILLGVFDGDADALFGLLTDPAADEGIRMAAFGAFAALVQGGRIARDAAEAFLVRFDEDRRIRAGDVGWHGWELAIGLLGSRDLLPRVAAAHAEGRLLGVMAGPEWCAERVAEAEAAPDDPARFEAERLAPVGHPLEEADDLLGGDMEDEPEPGEPVHNPLRNVGRNDPCPCGSGRKYKKCCLAA